MITKTVLIKSTKTITNIKPTKDFLMKINRLHFWKNHYQNFRLQFNKFDWNYWKTIPFSTPEDFNSSGIDLRIKDAESLFKKNLRHVSLGTFANKPNLLNVYYSSPSRKNIKKTLWMMQVSDSYSTNLKRILFSINSKKSKLLILKSPDIKINERLQISTLYIHPKDLTTFSNHIYDIQMKNDIKRVILTKPILNPYEIRLARGLFGDATISSLYPQITSGVFIQCPFAKKKYGINTVHLSKTCLAELYNINAGGWGEIIITKTKPAQLAYVRYKTGILGKVIYEKCKCGKSVFLATAKIKKPRLSLKMNKDFSIIMTQ